MKSPWPSKLPLLCAPRPKTNIFIIIFQYQSDSFDSRQLKPVSRAAASATLEPNMCLHLNFNTFDNHRKMHIPSTFHSLPPAQGGRHTWSLIRLLPQPEPWTSSLAPGLSHRPLCIPLAMSEEGFGLSRAISQEGSPRNTVTQYHGKLIESSPNYKDRSPPGTSARKKSRGF